MNVPIPSIDNILSHFCAISLTLCLYICADTLGNAYLTSFFVSGAWDRSKLHQSLKAYQNAVSECFHFTGLDANFHVLADVHASKDYSKLQFKLLFSC